MSIVHPHHYCVVSLFFFSFYKKAKLKKLFFWVVRYDCSDPRFVPFPLACLKRIEVGKFECDWRHFHLTYFFLEMRRAKLKERNLIVGTMSPESLQKKLKSFFEALLNQKKQSSGGKIFFDKKIYFFLFLPLVDGNE